MLVFLYIEKFRSLRRVGLNFDSNDRFGMKDGRLTYERRKVLPKRFFEMSKAPAGRIEAVSAIIGRNGTGKTSIAAFLNRILLEGKEELQYVAVFKTADEQDVPHYSCHYNLPQPLEDRETAGKIRKIGGTWTSKSNADEGESEHTDVSVIYYSPYYNPQGNFDSSGGAFVDISTAAMLGSLSGDVVGEFADEELERVIRYIEAIGSNVEEDGRPLPCPSELTIRGNADLIAMVQKTCINKAEKLTAKSPEPYVPLLSHAPGALNGLSDKDRGPLLKNGLFDWRSKAGQSACLHYVCDALDIGRLPCAFLQIVAGYLASCVNRMGATEDVLSRTTPIMRLADLMFGVRNHIMSVGKQPVDVQTEIPFERIYEAWMQLSKTSAREICYWCLEQLKALRISREEWAMPSPLESAQKEHDHFAIVVQKAFEIMQDGPETVWKSNEIQLAIRHPGQSVRLYGLLAAFRQREFDDFNSNRRSEFVTISPVGMSSGELAYMSLFARLHECLGGEPIGKRKYPEIKRNVILFLDEVETALHPDWQRQLVREVIRFVEERIPDRSVQVIFASHSPMLLSDIPSGNVCFLENLEGHSRRNAFGATLFDLYRNGFGVVEGTWGVFAESKIKELFAKVKLQDLSPEDKQVLDLIGDDVIRSFLKSAMRRRRSVREQWQSIAQPDAPFA